jgi:hypothetical protein
MEASSMATIDLPIGTPLLDPKDRETPLPLERTFYELGDPQLDRKVLDFAKRNDLQPNIVEKVDYAGVTYEYFEEVDTHLPLPKVAVFDLWRITGSTGILRFKLSADGLHIIDFSGVGYDAKERYQRQFAYSERNGPVILNQTGHPFQSESGHPF